MPSPSLWPSHPGYWLFGIVAVAALATYAPKVGGIVLLIVVIVLLGEGQKRGTLPWSH